LPTWGEAKRDKVGAYAKGLADRGSHFGSILRPLAYSFPHLWAVVLMFVAMLLYAGAHQGKLLLVKPFVDGVIPRAAADGSGFWPQLWFVTVVLLLFAVCEGVFRVAKEYLIKYVQFRTTLDIQFTVYRNTLHQEMPFFGRWQLGDILQRMSDDVRLMLNMLDLVLANLLLEPFLIAGGLVVAFYACWQLTLITLGVLLFIIFPLFKLGRKVRRQATKRQGYQARISQSRVQMVTGFKTIKLFGTEDRESDRFYDQTRSLFRKQMRAARSKQVSAGTTTMIAGIALAVAVFLGMAAIHKGIWGLTSGSLIQFLAACQAVFRPLTRLAKAYNKVNEALAGSNRVFTYLDSMETPVNRSGRPMDDLEPSIAVQHVDFRYGDDDVLNDVSFTAGAGQVTALVGASGAGKSTILDLAAGIYEVRTGRILVGGVDLEDIALDSYKQHVACVPQDPFLFAISLRENITYGRPDATDEEVVAAARVANIHDFIAALPNGYNTVVGERGQTLSGGQRQRVAIARAVLKDASILLLDEATSALDAESERTFYDALERLMRSGTKTVLVVAHRLSTVVNADKIIVLEGGRTIEEGTHAELMQKDGAYRRLFEAQFSETETGPPRHDTP